MTNQGNADATGVVVTDDLPPQASFVSALASQGTCQEMAGTVSCILGNLANSAQATVTITVTPTTAGMITNTANVLGNENDPVLGNNVIIEDTTVVDTDPPRVVDVLVRGTGWTQSFLDHLAATGMGMGGFSIPVGSGIQLQALPWANINQMMARFDEQVVIDQDDLLLLGSPGFAVPPFLPFDGGGFSYDAATFTATWTLSAPLAPNRLLIDLDGTSPTAVTDQFGNKLDGLWDNPESVDDPASDTYPSGGEPAVAGRDFEFRVHVLSGDVTGDGAVNFGDVLQVLALLPDGSSANPRADVNADGAINFADASDVLFRVPAELPAGEPSVAQSVPGNDSSGQIQGPTKDASAGRADSLMVVSFPPLGVDATWPELKIDVSAQAARLSNPDPVSKTELIDLVIAAFTPHLLDDTEEDLLGLLLKSGFEQSLFEDLTKKTR